MPVQRGPSAVILHGGAWISMRGGFLHFAQRHPGIQGGGDECVSQRVRPDALDDPGPAGRPADDPRCAVPVQPAAVCGQEDWPVCASPTARSMARAVRGASGIVTTLPPLRVTTMTRCPRSIPRFWMSAPVASDTHRPLSASRDTNACSAADPRPAATSSAPSSLRSSPVAWDS
ncbi:MAG TPA: hypothetical protein VKB62_03060 [Streptosporangiaceae bacterium]|nr:hypothetical protein [Streptosporangiaceae bacterium]